MKQPWNSTRERGDTAAFQLRDNLLFKQFLICIHNATAQQIFLSGASDILNWHLIFSIVGYSFGGSWKTTETISIYNIVKRYVIPNIEAQI